MRQRCRRSLEFTLGRPLQSGEEQVFEGRVIEAMRQDARNRDVWNGRSREQRLRAVGDRMMRDLPDHALAQERKMTDLLIERRDYLDRQIAELQAHRPALEIFLQVGLLVRIFEVEAQQVFAEEVGEFGVELFADGEGVLLAAFGGDAGGVVFLHHGVAPPLASHEFAVGEFVGAKTFFVAMGEGDLEQLATKLRLDAGLFEERAKIDERGSG